MVQMRAGSDSATADGLRVKRLVEDADIRGFSTTRASLSDKASVFQNVSRILGDGNE